MTNLSQQLCEICGIKEKWVEYTTETTDGCVGLGKKRVFPDFTQSENFVKLLKIANDVLGGVHFATGYTRNKPNIFEEQALMHYLPIAKLNDAFKLAIRKMEWVYG